MTKTSKDNDVTDLASTMYAENDIELSRLIRSGAVCNEKQIGRQYDRSYKCGISWKLDKATTWLIV